MIAKKIAIDWTQYYRWQFLRRNLLYRQGYENIKTAIKNDIQLVQDKETLYGLMTAARKEIKDFIQEFGINRLFNPALKNLPQDLRITGPHDFIVHEGSLDEVCADQAGFLLRKEGCVVWENPIQPVWFQPDDAFKSDFSEQEKKYNDKYSRNPKLYDEDLLKNQGRKKYIQVVINLDAGITRIKEEIDRMLKIEKAPRGPSAGKADYDLDLKIYDVAQSFKVKKGYKLASIARKLKQMLRKNPQANSRNSSYQVKDSLKRMTEFIDNQGYKRFHF